MLKIRLQRKGKRNKAYFNVVVTEHTVAAKGKYLELLGSYDPHTKELRVQQDRIDHWISKGSQLSPTANNLFIDKGIIKGEKVTSWKPKRKGKEAGAPTQAPQKTEEKKADVPAQDTSEDTKEKEKPATPEITKETSVDANTRDAQTREDEKRQKN